jgi:hypothetical protein
MAIKYTKWPKNIPNFNKICTSRYLHFPFEGFSKYYQSGLFGVHKYHLAVPSVFPALPGDSEGLQVQAGLEPSVGFFFFRRDRKLEPDIFIQLAQQIKKTIIPTYTYWF